MLDRVDTEVGEIEEKIPDHSEYITIPKFNEVPRSIFDIKLNQEIFPTKWCNKVFFFFGEFGFQNTFVYLPAFNTLGLKEDKGIDHVTVWKSKEIFGP